MKALIIGGTGTISMAITRQLAADPNWEVYLLNRGTRSAELPENVKTIIADINGGPEQEAIIEKFLNELDGPLDCVCEFLGFVPEQVERDYRLFAGKTRQYMYTSSASAYQKPLRNFTIREDTPLHNPYWEYSRNKAASEDFLMKKYREEGFPITLIRPSHTYDERKVPVGVHGAKGCWQVVKRIMEGKPVLVHGDGTSLWTMTFNTDFAKGYCGLMGNPHAIGQAFHITSDESVTWNQIYESIADALGVKLNAYHVSSDFLAAVGPQYDITGGLIGDKANTVVFDNSKLKTAVPGFCATIRLDQGMRIAVNYMLSHPETQVEDPEFDAWCDRVIEVLETAKKEF